MKILITGATGLVGSELRRSLREQGHELVLVSRKPYLKETHPLEHWVVGDLSQSEMTLLNHHSFDVAYHLMGESISDGRWTAKKKERLRRSRIDSTKNLISSLKIPPKTFISASAIGFYGDRGNEKLTEQSLSGNDFLSLLCVEWESEALKLSEKSRTIIARFGVVLHPESGAFPLMSKPFRLGGGAVLGSGQQWMSWIHWQDLIQLLVRIASERSVSGIYNFVAPEPVQNSEWSHLLAGELKKPLFLKVPQAVLEWTLGEMAQVLLSSQRVYPDRLLQIASPVTSLWKYPNAALAIRELLSSPRA